MTESILQAIMLVIKLFTLVGLGMYGLFALIILRQEHLMATVLEEKFEPFIRTLVLLHLGCAVFVFVMAIVYLP